MSTVPPCARTPGHLPHGAGGTGEVGPNDVPLLRQTKNRTQEQGPDKREKHAIKCLFCGWFARGQALGVPARRARVRPVNGCRLLHEF